MSEDVNHNKMIERFQTNENLAPILSEGKSLDRDNKSTKTMIESEKSSNYLDLGSDFAYFLVSQVQIQQEILKNNIFLFDE